MPPIPFPGCPTVALIGLPTIDSGELNAPFKGCWDWNAGPEAGGSSHQARKKKKGGPHPKSCEKWSARVQMIQRV